MSDMTRPSTRGADLMWVRHQAVTTIFRHQLPYGIPLTWPRGLRRFDSSNELGRRGCLRAKLPTTPSIVRVPMHRYMAYV
jgi:hypothetical protein